MSQQIEAPGAWMPLHVKDYLDSTQELSLAENGAYVNLLMDEWMNGPLPCAPDQLRIIARAERRAWPKIWTMLRAFFEQNGSGGLISPRLEIERQVRTTCALTGVR